MSMKEKKQKNTATIVFMAIIVIAIGVGFWAILENKSKTDQEKEFVKSENDEVNTILNKDYEINYPATPTEVVKAYSRISVCAYNQSMSDEELMQITEKMRQLFDEELLQANPIEEQLEDLKKDREEYKKAKKTISNYVVGKNSTVETAKIDGKECASLVSSYLVQEGNGYTKTYERFILRKDENGKWKILGWNLVEEPEETEEQ